LQFKHNILLSPLWQLLLDGLRLVPASSSHVAGTIGGVGNNGAGVVGVCQRGISMISAKFIGPASGLTLDAVLALDYLLDLKNRHNLNLVATSNSW
jgi:hypothetical protein